MSTAPKCPNHNEALDGIGSPPPKKGSGVCPVSGWSFEFEADWGDVKHVMDKNGNVSKVHGWDVTGEDDTQ